MAQTTVLNDLLSAISDRGRRFSDRGRSRRQTREDLIAQCQELLTGRGEASGVARACDVLESYADLDSAGRTYFFRALTERFGPDRELLDAAARTYIEAPDDSNARMLQRAAEPKRLELLRRLNHAPGGTKALVAMRLDLLQRLPQHPEFEVTDDDFAGLFDAWFNRGFLILRQIDWNTSAAVLEKIIRYEAVHEIAGWEDLRRRIDVPDRRLYAFFHPRLPDEPLIFVEIALTAGIPEAIGPILAGEREPLAPADADTAVFYSISNCQEGLRGISFGSFLIKQVAEDLKSELPHLRTFVTLSPVPGFARWVLEEREAGESILTPEIADAFDRIAAGTWREDEGEREAVARLIRPTAAWYLTRARDARGRVIDPVARFHLGNGARLERVNWPADVSEAGLKRAYGVMVNYHYDLDEIEKNHEAYANEGVVVSSSAVSRLARQIKPPQRAAGRSRPSETDDADRVA